jgi:hypothetical protein
MLPSHVQPFFSHTSKIPRRNARENKKSKAEEQAFQRHSATTQIIGLFQFHPTPIGQPSQK